MTSLWAEYLAERTGKQVLECAEGFAVYLFVTWDGESAVYLEDIYVRPDKRKSHVATQMADLVAEMARQKGCTVMIGSVAPNVNGSTRSLKVLLGYGMELARIDPATNLIFFTKGL